MSEEIVILVTIWSSSGRRPCNLRVRRANRVRVISIRGVQRCNASLFTQPPSFLAVLSAYGYPGVTNMHLLPQLHCWYLASDCVMTCYDDCRAIMIAV